jgi:hypothetical protein
LRKIALILFTGIILSGCSLVRNLGKETSADLSISKSENVFESVKLQNITDSSFFVQKAEFEITTQDGKEKFIGNIRYENSGRYLISLRSRSGIEGARIYITKDSILVNDRINKKLYLTSSLYLKRKFGFTQDCLPLIFGDIVSDRNYSKDLEKCSGESVKISRATGGMKFNYEIDCRKRKVILANETNNLGSEGLKIKYASFFRVGNILIPKIVEIDDPQYNAYVKIRIIRVEYPWSGTMKFVRGKDYELIELL